MTLDLIKANYGCHMRPFPWHKHVTDRSGTTVKRANHPDPDHETGRQRALP
jgi:hypothetical protein